MKKRITSIAVALLVCIAMNIPAFAVEESFELEESSLAAITTTTSEYQLAIEETQAMLEAAVDTRSLPNKTPLDEYKEAFDRRAALPVDTLLGMGYTTEEIKIMQGYLAGDYSFEEAATRAAAELTETLDPTTASASRFRFKYQWEWDKVPAKIGGASVSLAAYGINSNSIAFESEIQSSTARVTYYNTDGSLYGNEYLDEDVDTDTITASFDVYKLDSAGTNWVWAKKGYLIISIEPVASSTSYYAARASAGYAESSATSISFAISVSLLPPSFTASLSVTSGSGQANQVGGGIEDVFYV